MIYFGRRFCSVVFGLLFLASGAFVPQAKAELADLCWLIGQGLESQSTEKLTRDGAVQEILRYTVALLNHDQNLLTSGSEFMIKNTYKNNNIIAYLAAFAKGLRARDGVEKSAYISNEDAVLGYTVSYQLFREHLRVFVEAGQDPNSIGTRTYEHTLNGDRLDIEGLQRQAQTNSDRYQKYFKVSAGVTILGAIFTTLNYTNVLPLENFPTLFAALGGFFYGGLSTGFTYAASIRYREEAAQRGLEIAKIDKELKQPPISEPNEDDIKTFLGEVPAKEGGPNPYLVESKDFVVLLPVNRDDPNAKMSIVFKNLNLLSMLEQRRLRIGADSGHQVLSPPN